MNYLPRTLAGAIRLALRTFPAVLVTGSRQSGKTTLLRREFGKERTYVSFERPDVRGRALADPVSFLAEHPAPVILDEVQYVPDLLHYVKERIDEDRRPGRWLLTGSQSFALMRGITQTLAGRVAILRLDPLSTSEASAAPGPGSVEELLETVFEKAEAPRGVPPKGTTRADLTDWLLRGGYPEPRANPRVDREMWFAGYVQSYLERDVRDLMHVGDLTTFGRFVALIASRTANLLNMAEVGREIGVSGPTAKQWLSVLEASQIVELLKPYHLSYGKRIRKSPKLHVVDPGLASFLLGLHSRDALLHGPSLGALVETAVVTEWLKAFRGRGAPTPLHYWQSGSGIEIDLVIDYDGRLYGIEVKATATPTPRHADGLARWLEIAGPKARAVLACNVDRPATLRPGIRAVPWHLAWCGGNRRAKRSRA